MQLRPPLFLALIAAAGFLLPANAPGQTATCPAAGAILRIHLSLPTGSSAATANVRGSLVEASCTSDAPLAQGYEEAIVCDVQTPESCVVTVADLQPGVWLHEISVVEGDSAGQTQARRNLLASSESGAHSLVWPLYRSVLTIESLADGSSCTGCLREALTLSAGTPKPTLIQFSTGLSGTIVLSEQLPPLSSGGVVLDGFDGNGLPHSREIDGNGIDAPALIVTSTDNTILGLRIRNVGGNSDSILIEGPEANGNVLESLQVMGRAETVCGPDLSGCLIDGVCRNFACGDDGIAIRGQAGELGINVIRNCEVTHAFDKGVKVSNLGHGQVERSHIHSNRDGGLQATLSGSLIAVENLVELNRGTNSASGMAANGPEMGSSVPSRLRTTGNLSRWNSLRGISVRSLSEAILSHDHVCGNGTVDRGIGFGIAVFDAAGLSAVATAQGLAAVHNLDGGVAVADSSVIDLGGVFSEGLNAFAFNGPQDSTMPANLRTTSNRLVPAANNHWQHCGRRVRCNPETVLTRDVFQQDGSGGVDITAPSSGRRRGAIEIESISPRLAMQGELVRIYGRWFDAIEGNAPTGSCDSISTANTCRPPKGNCVVVGGQPAEVVAVTPTMLVIRAPFTCFEPTTITVRNARTRGVARHDFCLVDEPVPEASS